MRAGALAVNGGTVSVLPDGGAGGLSILTGLSFAGAPRARTSTLDLADNDLLIDYTTPGTIEHDVRELVRDGRLSFGITSRRTDADDMILAVADNAQLQRTTWLGQTIDASTIIGAYTYFGDANLDGQVTTDDYVAVDLGLGTGDSWIEGDFDMNGAVTTDDYVAVDLNLGKGTSDPLAYAEKQAEMVALHTEVFGQPYLVAVRAFEAGHHVVPEPSAVVSLLGALCVVGARRRGGRISDGEGGWVRGRGR